LPTWPEWKTAGPALTELEIILADTGSDPVFSAHPFSQVNEAIFLSDAPHRALEEAFGEALKALDAVERLLGPCRLEPQQLEDLQLLKQLVQFAVLLYPLARVGRLSLADPGSEEARELDRQFGVYRRRQEEHREAIQKNVHWKQRLDETDLDQALILAAKYEGSFLAGLNGRYRRLTHQLRQRYDLAAHTARPSWLSLLELLKAEYAAAAQVEQTRRQLQEDFGLDQPIDTARLSIDLLHSKKGHPGLDWLMQHPDAGAVIAAVQALNEPLGRLETGLKKCFNEPPETGLPGIRDSLMNVQLNAHTLRDWLPALRAFTSVPATVKATLRRLPLTIRQAEAVVGRKALQDLYQTHRSYAGIDGQALEKAVMHLSEAYPALLKMNAELIRAFVRQRCLGQLELSNRAASQLSEEEKLLKKTYAEGRKILENEFGKSMRYKSIRELSEKESGPILKALKPVWLMSPYSVSDSLPLDADHFDVVIFDEASQIKLEEGVPALYRSRQAIIVGDEKQMPPTDFFNAGAPADKDPDDLDRPADAEDDDWLAEDADSLLAQGARKLESTLLSWHYRSHSETLISYSNHAFYEGKLMTIPDKTIHERERAPILVRGPEDAATFADLLLERSISYHFLEDSVYERRSNQAEADYIARMVRELLQRGRQESIGIVAFSQQQQHAIEASLERLAGEDPGFSQLLEEAFVRTENDQFTGLIIKNLENIQGDERDIILISVCYGPDSRRRMIMNFGPVNKKGGERRLNVLFSRARKHMAVVASIRHDQITNEYNEGAGYLRRFLQYAELASLGKMAAARTILDSLAPNKTGKERSSGPVISGAQLKEQLEARGYEVAGPIGQSDFKCSLAVRSKAEDGDYRLAILVDDEKHYHNDNLFEQYYQRPAILRGFGWKVLPLYAKDWLHQPMKVIEQAIRAMGEQVKETPVPAPSTSSPDDRLEFRRLIQGDGGDGSFWEAAADGARLIVRWGRTGAKGQTRLRTFPDEESARAALERQVAEQEAKGYRPDQEPR
jgi:predicted DNA-binding WGR domain protein